MGRRIGLLSRSLASLARRVLISHETTWSVSTMSQTRKREDDSKSTEVLTDKSENRFMSAQPDNEGKSHDPLLILDSLLQQIAQETGVTPTSKTTTSKQHHKSGQDTTDAVVPEFLENYTMIAPSTQQTRTENNGDSHAPGHAERLAEQLARLTLILEYMPVNVLLADLDLNIT